MRLLLPRLALGLTLVAGTPAPSHTAAPTDPTGGSDIAQLTARPQPECRTGRVALTFDDGPSARQTARLVAVLDRLRVPATFFVIGRKVERRPATTVLVAEHGYRLGNHTYRHERLRFSGRRQVAASLRADVDAIVGLGLPRPTLFRPPFGETSRAIVAAARRQGMTQVLWSVDSRDWAGGGPRAIADRIVAQLRPHVANVVLQHDGVPNSAASVSAVPLVVAAARRMGYCFVGLDDHGRPLAQPPRPRDRSRVRAEHGVLESEPMIDALASPLAAH